MESGNKNDHSKLQVAAPIMTTTIYVLELADHCWYVGKTSNIEARYQQHLTGNGSAWTRLHRPITISATFTNASPFDEDKVTKEYMARFGIDKVRGGAYVQINLSIEQRHLIQREIWGSQDRCFFCGSNEHFASNCPGPHFSQKPKSKIGRICIAFLQFMATVCEIPESYQEHQDPTSTSTTSTPLTTDTNEESATQPTPLNVTRTPKPKAEPKAICKRCGRTTHTEESCYAAKHLKGYALA